MDQEPEDWEEKKRIKAEIRQAEDAKDTESKANVANLGAESFAPRKGYTRDKDALGDSAERLSEIAVFMSVGGAVLAFPLKYLNVGNMWIIAGALIILAVIPGIAAIVAAIMYKKATGKDAMNAIISGVYVIVAALLFLIIVPNMKF